MALTAMALTSPREGKLFNDCVHGHFVLPKLCVSIIDTCIFQRLRNIKQLGFGYYVYPGASHNRYEHSLGVCYLAGELVDTLNKNSNLDDEVKISPLEKLCIQVAGLCHDLGHGPFSHSWEKFVHAAHKNKDWKHEEMSVSLFDLILENKRVKREFECNGLNEEHKMFIKDLILGKKDEQSDRVFLFEIISNKETGIDVDKWDYLLRDGKQLNINITFDPHRLLKCQRVIKVHGKYHICYRNKERENIFHMYMMRAELHRMAYQHPVVKMIEEMWLDALLEADANDYMIKGVKLSETHKDPAVFSYLTDYLFQAILCSEEKFSIPRKLLERILNRKLYKWLNRALTRTEEAKYLKRTEVERRSGKDLYITTLELEMPDLAEKVFLYDKENVKKAKLERDWSSVPVFPHGMTQMFPRHKRLEVLFFCKEPERQDGNALESLRKTVSDIISEVRGTQ